MVREETDSQSMGCWARLVLLLALCFIFVLITFFSRRFSSLPPTIHQRRPSKDSSEGHPRKRHPRQATHPDTDTLGKTPVSPVLPLAPTSTPLLDPLTTRSNNIVAALTSPRAPTSTPLLDPLTTRSNNIVAFNATCSLLLNMPISNEQFCKKGILPPSRSSRTLRIAVLLRGESFRSGSGIGDRSYSLSQSAVTSQREAAKSLVHFVVAPLEACGFAVHIWMITYSPLGRLTRDMKDLMAWYGTQRLRKQFLVDDRKKHSYTQKQMLTLAYKWLLSESKKADTHYDAVVVTRPDVVFKMHIFSLRANWDGMLVPFRMLERYGTNGSLDDHLLWFPWTFANCVYFCTSHPRQRLMNIWNCLRDFSGGQLSLLLQEPHDADTKEDRNPMFKLVRQESNIDVNGGFAVLVTSLPGEHFDPHRCESIRRCVFYQGDPPTKWTDIYVHGWLQPGRQLRNKQKANQLNDGDEKKCSSIRDAIGNMLNYSVSFFTPHPDVVCDSLSSIRAQKQCVDLHWNAWQSWSISLNSLVSRVASTELRVGFEYDGLALIRSEKACLGNHQISAYNTSWAVIFVQYFTEADREHDIPSLIIASSSSARLLSQWLQRYVNSSCHSTVGIFTKAVWGAGLTIRNITS